MTLALALTLTLTLTRTRTLTLAKGLRDVRFVTVDSAKFTLKLEP